MVGKIIALCGHAGAGKSTLAESLYRHHGYTRTSFAMPMKRMLAQLMIYQHAPLMHLSNPETKSSPSPWLNNKTPRHALQTLGTEWGREWMGNDFWIKIWEHRIERCIKVVVDDLRFVNEAERIRKLGGLVVRIERDDTEGSKMQHISELELDSIVPNLIVVNDGKPEDMLKEFEHLMGDQL